MAPLSQALLLLIAAGVASGQSVESLREHFSGKTEWKEATGTLTFASTGEIAFPKGQHKAAFWDVPREVERIVIDRDVRVTGAFHTRHDCLIEGEDRKTSVVFGTAEQRWADSRGLKAYQYCQFQNRGGILTVRNLTARNPFAFFIRGWGHVCHTSHCDFIDDRGGWGNHSDGFSGGHGSTVDNCHFETGDDAIKLYFDIKVTNCTIKMIQNCVPFQFGWGNYEDSECTVENVVITGDRGRSKTPPVFQWKSGKNLRKVSVTGLVVDNPNARLFDLNGEGRLDLTIADADIKVKEYGTPNFRGTRTICGTTKQRGHYQRRESTPHKSGS